MSESKQVNYVADHKASANRHAARTAVDCAGFLIPRLEKLPRNFKYLDLGCGPGSITLDLAARFPEATFRGIDSSTITIEQAHSLAASRGVTNASFRIGDIMNLDDGEEGGSFPWGSFDVVYAHQVLVHMQKPVEGLKVMRRAAKEAGGIVAARDSFTSGQIYSPGSALMDRFVEMNFAMIGLNGSDPELGKKLVSKAKEAGWDRGQITASCSTSSFVTESEKRSYGENIIALLVEPGSDYRKKAIKQGAVESEQAFDEMADEFRRWLADDAAWGAYVSGEIICENYEW